MHRSLSRRSCACFKVSGKHGRGHGTDLLSCRPHDSGGKGKHRNRFGNVNPRRPQKNVAFWVLKRIGGQHTDYKLVVVCRVRNCCKRLFKEMHAVYNRVKYRPQLLRSICVNKS